MGQKTNPIGFRLAVNKDWRSKWFASRKEFPEFLASDIKIRASRSTAWAPASTTPGGLRRST